MVCRWVFIVGFAVPSLMFAAPLAPVPVVQIVALDAHAYESTNVARAGRQTATRPTRPAAFLVTRKGLLDESLTVFYRIGGTASNGIDYNRLTGRVTIPAGGRSAAVVVRPIDDALAERRTVRNRVVSNETVILTLIPRGYRVGGQSRAIAVIVDNDPVHAPDGAGSVGGVVPINLAPRTPRVGPPFIPRPSLPARDGVVVADRQRNNVMSSRPPPLPPSSLTPLLRGAEDQ